MQRTPHHTRRSALAAAPVLLALACGWPSRVAADAVPKEQAVASSAPAAELGAASKPVEATAPAGAAAATGEAQPAAGTASAAAPAADGERELAQAKESLDHGERAPDDASRRAAYETAKQHADRAVELLPDSAEARFVQFGADGRLAQMGGVAVAALQLVKLNKQLDEVLRLDPNHANALAARGGMLMKLPRLLGGNTTKGIEYLERSVEMDRTAVGKRMELAEAYHIVGRDQDADATAQQALEVAKEINDPQRIATVERFIAELKNTCPGCAVAAIGR